MNRLFLKPLIDAGNEEAAVRLAEMCYDTVAPEGRTFKGALTSAWAIWASIGTFACEYLCIPLMRDSPEAKSVVDAVKLGTCPMELGHDDRYGKHTGWARKDFAFLRARRLNPFKHQHTSGLLHKIRKRPKNDAVRVAKKVEAMQFWVRKTAPRNLGAGKRDLVVH